ncbi:hypothetical protein Scep_016399 [Stephania cephalantha]|uniref:Uncharacterized protein n=1 Tax=Stephania cephalantha TaxID=152367 RepID=A0AAP0IPB8_9MAGN
MQQIRLPLTTTWCKQRLDGTVNEWGWCKQKGAPTNHVADFEQDESDSDSDKQQKLVDKHRNIFFYLDSSLTYPLQTQQKIKKTLKKR